MTTRFRCIVPDTFRAGAVEDYLIDYWGPNLAHRVAATGVVVLELTQVPLILGLVQQAGWEKVSGGEWYLDAVTREGVTLAFPLPDDATQYVLIPTHAIAAIYSDVDVRFFEAIRTHRNA